MNWDYPHYQVELLQFALAVVATLFVIGLLLWRRRVFWRLRHWWRRVTHPPVVVISHSGQATKRPQVHVSVASVRGAQGVYTWDANEQGEASASMYGQGLADIMQRRLVDEREEQE